MMTLDTVYQYLGRSNPVKAYGADYNYYLLLYARTDGDPATGKHSVSVKMRLACEKDATFYGWRTDGLVTVAGEQAIAWENQNVPGIYWGDSYELTEDGVTYRRYVDLKEGTVEVDAAGAEVEIHAEWLRLDVVSDPPRWLPSTTKALADFTVQLPAIEQEDIDPVLPDEDDDNLPDDEPVEPEEPVEPVAADLSGVSVYADGVLAYDSRLEDYDGLIGLTSERGVNIGGTAQIIMPAGYPAYNYFVGHKTIVTIYRGNVLRFRGRALFHADTILGQRTVTCEGELCLLRDGIHRPHLYKSTPAKIFRHLIRMYNEQVEPWKRFSIGTVTVTDPNGYIRLESEDAESILDTINKLVERCGGYIKFTTKADGTRAIHWLASLNQRSAQTIELGENLLDFSSTGANTTELATALVPYGAKDEKTKKRITIESVNGGKDYIMAEDAKAYRGTIYTHATWNDVTEPTNLLIKARKYLAERKVFITSLELTALDLSYLDKDIDSFTEGDMVRVVSPPHNVNEDFQLTKIKEDHLRMVNSRITMGKEILSLTGADVAADFKGQAAVAGVKNQYNADLDGIATTVETSVLEKTSGAYADKTTTAQQLAALTAKDTELQQAINNEVSARAGMISKVGGVVSIGGGAPININGSTIDFQKEIRFLNESGIRIANKDGSYYYVLRVDASNNCFLGNDYVNVYLRAKDAVYLHKTGAVVTSDRRHKNSVEELPEAYEGFLDKLQPVRFRYNGDESGRYHVGFVAQDVEAALTDAGLQAEDFGGFMDVSGDGSNLGLAYDEFVGLLLQKIRKLETRIKALEDEKK